MVAERQIRSRQHHRKLQHIDAHRRLVRAAVGIRHQQRRRKRVHRQVHQRRGRSRCRRRRSRRHIATPAEHVRTLPARHARLEHGHLSSAHVPVKRLQVQHRALQHRQRPRVHAVARPRAVLVGVGVVARCQRPGVHLARARVGYTRATPCARCGRREVHERHRRVHIADHHIRTRLRNLRLHNRHLHHVAVLTAVAVHIRVRQLRRTQPRNRRIEHARRAIHDARSRPRAARGTEPIQLLGDRLVAQQGTRASLYQWKRKHRQRHFRFSLTTVDIGHQQLNRSNCILVRHQFQLSAIATPIGTGPLE